MAEIDLFTDYIVSPLNTPSNLNVFSVLDYSCRKEWVEDKSQLQLVLCSISDCILRVTRVFPNSPCEIAGICPNEYIVGSLQGDYTCLRTFVAMLHKHMTQAKTDFSFGVCNIDGFTRMVVIATASLQQWLAANKNTKGILGCELAEGWMHKFKPKVSSESSPNKNSLKQASPPQRLKKQITNIVDVENEIEYQTGKLEGMTKSIEGKLVRIIQY